MDGHLKENTSLIATSKVKGAAVYNASGDSLGSIDDIILDKRSGHVAYAIMSFGGFLGVGSNYHPLPWSVLNYDTAKGGYVVNLSRSQLEKAPTYQVGTDPAWGDKDYETKIHRYYGAGPYWGDTWP
jgi:hypothetical protein